MTIVGFEGNINMIQMNRVERETWNSKASTQWGKTKPRCKKLNEGRRTKEYGLKIERQVLVWVSSALMLKDMGLEVRSRISFSHCVAFSFFSCSSFLSLPFLKMNFILYCFSSKAKYVSK